MKNKLIKAFTLVELVVVASLLGIIMTAVVMVLRPAQKHYTDINNKSQEQDNVTTVTDLINAELRYATGIKVVYADKSGSSILGDGSSADISTFCDHDTYPNYIRLSNNYRETIGEIKVRGFAEKGRIQSDNTMAKQDTILNRAMFKDFDYQFSVMGYNTSEGQQSMTIGVDATPMIAQANDIETDEVHAHHFEDTFKFMNLRNKSRLQSDKILGLSPAATELSVYLDDSDADIEANEYGEIYIFYCLPANLPVDAGGGDDSEDFGEMGLGDGGAYDPLIPTLLVNDEGVGGVNTIVFVSMPSPGYSGSFKVKPQGTDTSITTINEWGEHTFTSEQNLSFGGAAFFEVYVSIGEGGSIKINETDNANREVPTITAAHFATTNKVYVFDPGNNPQVSTTNPLATPEDAKNITVHYLYSVADVHPGMQFSEVTTNPDIVQIDGSNAVASFINCSGNRDVVVTLFTAASSIKLSAGFNGTDSNWMSSPETEMTLDNSSPDEIWIYRGEIYPTAPTTDEGTVIVHYVSDFDDTYGGYIASTNISNTVVCEDGTVLPNFFDVGGSGGHGIFRNPAESFDTTFTGTDGSDLIIGWVHSSIGTVTFARGTTQEIWVYNGQVFTSAPEIPQWRFDMTIHYLGEKPDSSNIGIKLIDVDTFTGSSLCNDVGIVSRSGDYSDVHNLYNINLMPGYEIPKGPNGTDTQYTLSFLRPDAEVCICSYTQYGGRSLKTITYDRTNPNQYKDIWIYGDSWYATAEEANANYVPDPTPGNPVVEYVLGNSWGTGSPNQLTGQPTITVTAQGGPISHCRVRVMFTRNVTGVNLWDSSIGYTIDSGDTRVVYFDIYNIPENTARQISCQIGVTSVGGEAVEFSIAEISAELVP